MCDSQGKDANGGGTVLCVGHINHIKLRFRSSSSTICDISGFSRVVLRADMTALLSQIRVPTLLLTPARSSLTPLHEQVKVRDTIPGAQMAVIDGRGHELYVDEPEACTAALVKFLRSLEYVVSSE
jgi:pimeloyl-ACP methyl ester carboxylesterase